MGRARRIGGPGVVLGSVMLSCACAGEGTGEGTRTPPEIEAIRPAPVALDYVGTTELEGDFAKPGERRAFASTLRALASGPGSRLLEQRTWSDGGDAPPQVETTLVRDERVWRSETRGGREGPGFVELTGAAASAARDFAELPWRAPAPFSGGSGDSDIRREQWRAHPRLGDVLETTHYSGVRIVHGRACARQLTFEHFGDFDSQRAEFTLREAKAAPEAVRELDAPTTKPATPANASAVRIERLAPELFLVDDPSAAVRALAVGFEDHFVVLEAPASSAAGERIVDALAAAHPGRPIRTVLFSHHHARFCGGLRAFLAEGATIVTTADDAAFVEATVTRPFTLAPDRLARRGGKLRIETFDADRRFADAGDELEVLKFGAASNHSDDALVFWLPRARLLVTGDLGWSAFEGGAPVVGASGRALADFIAARKLDVATLVQTLRVVGGPAALPFSDWLRAVPPAPSAPADQKR